MSITGTLIVQMIVFMILVVFTMKFIWPPLTKALDERTNKVAEGLAAAEHAKVALTNAHQHVEVELAKTRNETAARIADAERRAMMIIEEAKLRASEEAACVPRWPNWPSRAPSRFCARKSMPVFTLIC